MILLDLKNIEELLVIVSCVLMLGSLIPTYILFSRHVYKKYGVLRTKFTSSDLFYFPNEFKLFMRKHSVYLLFGIMTFFCWGVSVVVICIYIMQKVYNIITFT